MRPTPSAAKGLEQAQRASDIVGVVAGRLGHRLGDQAERREMHGRGDLVLAHRGPHRVRIAVVGLDQRPPFDRVGMAGAQVVQGHRPIARLRQGLAGMGPDIAGAAQDQNGVHFGLQGLEQRLRVVKSAS